MCKHTTSPRDLNPLFLVVYHDFYGQASSVFAHSHLELNQVLCKIEFLMNVAKLVSVCDYYIVFATKCQPLC